MYSYPDIADALEAGLVAAAQRLDDEQAVYGLDASNELELHPRLAEAIASAGYGVHREQRYPSDRKKRKESEGERFRHQKHIDTMHGDLFESRVDFFSGPAGPGRRRGGG